MNKEIKKTIKTIVSYLADEDTHFMENCECEENEDREATIENCKCPANKHHIYRDVVKLKNWLRRNK